MEIQHPTRPKEMLEVETAMAVIAVPPGCPDWIPKLENWKTKIRPPGLPAKVVSADFEHRA